MKLPKTFIPNKSLDKKTEELIEYYKKYENADPQALAVLEKLDLKKGLMYACLRTTEFEQSNLPEEKVALLGIACSSLYEKFYRYRFNYRSKGEGIRWLEVTDTRFKDNSTFEKVIMELVGYYRGQQNPPHLYRRNHNKYILKFEKPHTKKSLKQDIDNFYCKNFPYLGTKYNLFINKLVYKDVTEEEFLKSNLPAKRVEVKWKNRKKI